MKIQTSFAKGQVGTLFVVPTPIGNLEDITIRALNVLKQVDMIAAEDTRHTIKLLNHFTIENKLTSYHEHNRMSRTKELIEHVQLGKEIALVSDAGMPGISDPGYDLVKAAIEADVNVVVLPGANAALCALVGSGLSTEEFLFYGFLPRKKSEKEKELERLSQLAGTLLFYESPYRIKDTLQLMLKMLGNRQVVIAREITKMYEQYIRGSLEEAIKWADEHVVKGECCIVLEGVTAEALGEVVSWWSELSISEHVQHYEVKENLQHKEALRRVATDRQISRREVYQHIHVNND